MTCLRLPTPIAHRHGFRAASTSYQTIPPVWPQRRDLIGTRESLGISRWGAVSGGLVESDDAGHSGPSQSFPSCVSNLSPLRQFPLEHDDFLQGLVWRCPWIFTSHSK
jgi:hypothetical protein